MQDHTEYGCQAWRTHLLKDIDGIEKVQRNATRMTPEIFSLSYQERLHKCYLSPKMRRFRSDSILLHEIVKGFAKVETDKFF